MHSRRKLVIGALLIGIVLSFFGHRNLTQEISLFDLPGTKSHSLRFWMFKRGLGMREVSVDTVLYQWIKMEFPDVTSIYVTPKIPMIIMMKGDLVNSVRIGDRLGFSERSHIITPALFQKIRENLAGVNVDFPYELMLCENHESAFQVLRLPYWGIPNIQKQGELSHVNFESESGAPYPVTVYWVSDRIAGFEIHASHGD